MAMELHVLSRKPGPKLKFIGKRFPTERQRSYILAGEAGRRFLNSAILHSNDGLEVVPVEGKGLGVIDTKNFSPGDYVVRYMGKFMKGRKAVKREAKRDAHGMGYVFFFRFKGVNYAIDAATLAKPAYGFGRYANHSMLTPNAKAVKRMINGKPAIILQAITSINAGDEILYDYGKRNPEAMEANPFLRT